MVKTYSSDRRGRISTHVSSGHWRRDAARQFGVRASGAVKPVQRVATNLASALEARPGTTSGWRGSGVILILRTAR